MATILALVATAIPAAADPPPVTITSDPLLARGRNYDYGASIIQENGVRKIWWCGQTKVDNKYETDGIFYLEQNLATGALTEPKVVLVPTPDIPGWDRSYICDPSVIAGAFVNPDDKQTYAYAMYYTATDRGPGAPESPRPGSNGRIGIAYSNDGITWLRYTKNPIIFPEIFPTDWYGYGAGQGATFNASGRSDVWLTYTDNSEGTERIFLRTTTDGVTFGSPIKISTNGLPPGNDGQIANGDFAFDPVGRYWYGAFANGYGSSQGFRINVDTDGNKEGESERYQFGIYRMPEAEFPGGSWEHIAFVDTNLTGAVLNHNTALVRDGFGNVTPTLPKIETVFSRGNNDSWEWDLGSVSVPADPTNVRTPLNRYRSESSWLTTSGKVASGFTLDGTVGDLYLGMKPGTTALYACSAGPDTFVSTRPDCEGQRSLGVNGYFYLTAPEGVPTVPLYRCFTGNSHYVVNDNNCGSAQSDGLLGYALAPND